MPHNALSCSKITLSVILGLFLMGCEKNDTIRLETKVISLEYSESLAGHVSRFGLVDITKLEPRKEIESINIKGARIPSPLYSGQIIVLDANSNNTFVDDATDYIGLGNLKGTLEFETINFIKYKQPLIVKICHEFFALTIDNDGSTIYLNKLESEKVDYDLTYPYKLPEREVTGLYEKLALKKGDGKYTYIEFWGTWCKPCLKLIPELKVLNKYYSDRLNLVSINYGDKDLDVVREVVKIKKMNWDQVVADEQLEKEFGNPVFVPCGILFNPDGYLVKYGILPEEVKAYVRNN